MPNIQHERDKVRRPCIAYLRQVIAYNQLKRYPFLYWTCPPDLGKQKPQVIARMKKDGYEKGVYDLTIIAGDASILKVWLIEFKYGANKLTAEQQVIWDKAASIAGIQTLIIKSYEEFKEFITANFK